MNSGVTAFLTLGCLLAMVVSFVLTCVLDRLLKTRLPGVPGSNRQKLRHIRALQRQGHADTRLALLVDLDRAAIISGSATMLFFFVALAFQEGWLA